MIRYIKILLLLFIIRNAYSQQQDTLKLSLQSALDMGMQSRFDLKNQKLQTDLSSNESKKLNTKNLPQLTATADFRYWTTLQSNVIPGNAFGGPSGGPDKIIKFGLPYNNNIAFNLKQNVFDPSLRYDQKIYKSNTRAQQLTLDQNKTDARLSIAEAYYTVLLNKEKFNLSKSSVERNRQYFSSAVQKFNNKNLTLNDQNKFKLDLNNSMVSLKKDSFNLLLSKINLLNEMGLNPETPLVLTDSLSVTEEPLIENPNQGEHNNRIEVKMEKLQLSINDLNIKKQNYTYLPTIQLYANHTFQQLSREFRFFDSNTWYPYNYFGLQVNLTIFDGMLKNRTKSEYFIRKDINKNNLDKLKSDINYELLSAYTTLQTAYESVTYARDNYKQALDLINIYQLRFKEGTVLQSDLVNTEYSLITAQNNLLNAYYDYLLAKLKWQKAKGEL